MLHDNEADDGLTGRGRWRQWFHRYYDSLAQGAEHHAAAIDHQHQRGHDPRGGSQAWSQAWSQGEGRGGDEGREGGGEAVGDVEAEVATPLFDEVDGKPRPRPFEPEDYRPTFSTR